MFSHVTSLSQLDGIGELLHFIVVDATTWFVFISGYLFYRIEHKRFEYRDYLLKKAKYVILPYLVLSVPAIAAGLYFARHQILGLSPEGYAAWSLLVGGAVVGPMWFIPMITLFFICSWVFQKLGGTRLLYPVTVVALAISLFSSRPVGDLNPALSFVHFLGFYLLGICAASGSRFTDRIKDTYVGSVFIAIGLLVFSIASWIHGAHPEALGFYEGWGELNVVQLGKLSLLISLFLLLERYSTAPSRFLGYLAKISFGLFFIHGFFVLVFAKVSQYVSAQNLYAIFLVEFSLVVFGSILIVFLVKLALPNKSRYVIGC
jgi:hypothetical protein